MLRITESQMQTMALERFAERLHEFMRDFVTTSRSISRSELRDEVFQRHPFVAQCGFDSEVNFALYLIMLLCLPERAAGGELKAFILRQDLSIDEKRYRLSADLDEAGIMAFGALEYGE
jgi:hypothetical protein